MDAVVHFEVPYDDADRARAFYRDAFGWEIQSMPEFDYDFVQTGPQGEDGMPTGPGYIGGGMCRREGAVTQPVITLAVDDVGAALERVRSSGGSPFGEPVQVGDMGWSAYFTDSEGNLMGLWQSASG
jgi:predicted enzyme related to lactoylglutathione lyase